MNKTSFVHLRTRSHYSFFRSILTPEQIAARAAQLKMPGAALVDYGVLFGIPEFMKACSRHGVLPIIGMEIESGESALAQDRDNGSLVLMARNAEGLANLYHISSTISSRGGVYLPLTELRECAEGLLCLTGHRGTRTGRFALRSDINALEAETLYLQDIFGPDNLYYSIESEGKPAQEAVIKVIAEASERMGVPVVSTGNVLCLEPEDSKFLNAFKCLGNGADYDPEAAVPDEKNHFLSLQEISTYIDENEWHRNTLKVLEKCSFPTPLYKPAFPDFPVPGDYPAPSYLEHICRKTLENRLPADRAASERLNRELGVIERMGFSNYFLVMWDLVREAKKRGIPAVGRGSVTGSLTAWLLDITAVNPLDYGLLFERFLNPDRLSLPDVDLDVAHNRREEIIDYIVESYGRDRVAQIIAFGTLKARAALRDCARLLKVPKDMVDPLAARAGNETLSELMKDYKFRSMVRSDRMLSRLMDYALRFEGLIRHATVHAAGVVLSDCCIEDRVPLYTMHDGTVVTGYTKDFIEELGLIKIDVLGLKTLTVVHEAESLVEERTGKPFPAKPSEREKGLIFKRLGKGRTTGVFQLESAGITELTIRMKPTRIEDIIALIALYRPGPLGSGMVDEFISRRNSLSSEVYAHPALKDILQDTCGVFVYQEQVMKAAMMVAGFMPAEADKFRKAMSSKDSVEMQSLGERFVQGSVKGGMSNEDAEELFNNIMHFAGYGFNKSHSTAYALLAFRTAWLKTVYPLEYLSCLMSRESDQKLRNLVKECRNLKIRLLPPDVERSSTQFLVENNNIRLGLSAVKNIGGSVAEVIISERMKNDGNFGDVHTFLKAVAENGVHRAALESLIDAGALDCFGMKRSQIHSIISRGYESSRGMYSSRQMALTDLMSSDSEVSEDNAHDIPEFHDNELLRREKASLGFLLSHHPLAAWEATLNVLVTHTVQRLSEARNGAVSVVGGMVGNLNCNEEMNDERASFRIEDFTGEVTCIALDGAIDPKDWKVSNGDVVVARGRVRDDGNVRIFVAERVLSLDRIYSRLSMVGIISVSSNSKISSLKEIFKDYPGESPVYLEIKNKGTVSTMLCDDKVSFSENFMRALEALDMGFKVRDISVM